MKKNLLYLVFSGIALSAAAQTEIVNGEFENWGNATPGNADEPTGWYSNKTGSTVAKLGPQTAFKETSNPHSGAACVRIESKSVPVIGTVVNGNLTTGVVNAPNQTKAEGYIGTINYSTPADQRRMAFTGRPDSLVGWFKYEQPASGTGATLEKGKIRAILHTGDYFDPETPVNNNHANLSANKIGDALFNTAASNTTVWKRFSVPFNYASGDAPAFIMINITSSDNQLTSVSGSKLWLDDLKVVYNTSTIGVNETNMSNFNVYSFERTIYVDLADKNDNNATLNVLDLTGKVVFTQKVESNQMNAVAMPSSLTQGTYLYQVAGSEIQKTGKVIIK